MADLITGDILIEHDADTPRPIASISKLTTILTAFELKLPVGDLVYPLLLESNNEAAEQISKLTYRTSFIKYMNDYVARLGMMHTHYSDPSGLSSRNVSSASDLLILARHLFGEHRDILDLTLVQDHGDYENSNLFVKARDSDYLGGKSGYTPEAGGTLLSIFDLPLAGGMSRPIVVIVLGTDSNKEVKYELVRTLNDYLLKYVTYR